MGYEEMKQQRRVPRQLLTIALVLICLATLGYALALTGSDVQITVTAHDASRIAYEIESARQIENAKMVVAVSKNGAVQQTVVTPVSMGIGTYSDEAALTEDYDSFKLMLVNAETLAPLSQCAGSLNAVRFVDADGTLLYKALTALGEDAAPPETPEQAGSRFMRWDGDFTAVKRDSTVTAVYVPQDAANTFTVTSADATAGGEVTVTVSLTGTVELGGFDVSLWYDEDALEFVSLDAEFDFGAVAANHVAEEHAIRMNYLDARSRNFQKTGDIMNVTFRAKDNGRSAAPIGMSPRQLFQFDPDDKNNKILVDGTFCEGVVRIG